MKNLTKTPMNAQQGFTLIELVVVIVILGILAVTAAPKFIDLTSDARVSVMKGVKGSIESAVSLVHSKALIEGQTGEAGFVTIDNVSYALVYGYPAKSTVAGSDSSSGSGIIALIDLDTSDDGDFTTKDGTGAADGTGALFQHSGATDPDTCQLSYANAVEGERPVITESLDGC